MSIVIIDGIDRVGKTTLALLLEEKLNAKIFKDAMVTGELSKDMVTEKIATVTNMLTLWPKNDIIIIDRFHISELVYGMLDRNYVNEYMVEIDKKLARMDAIYIWVKPNDIKWSSEQHGKDLSMHDKWFGSYFNQTAISKKFCCDYTTLGIAVEWLKEVL